MSASFSVAPAPASQVPLRQRCRHGACRPVGNGRTPKEASKTTTTACLSLPTDALVDCIVSTSLSAATTWPLATVSTSSSSASSFTSPPGPEIWVGALAPALVYAAGAYNFSARLLIQKRCPECSGTGLVSLPINNDATEAATASGTNDDDDSSPRPFRKVKCPLCGGFFPWESASRFFSATARPGNGGRLLFPRNQKNMLYTIPSANEASEPSSRSDSNSRSTSIEGESTSDNGSRSR